MVSITITHWHITPIICRLWYMTLPRSIWLTRLASTNSLLRFLFLSIFVSFLTLLVASFSLGIQTFAWVLNMIHLSLLEVYTMISQEGASWSWISLVQLNPTDATLVDAGYWTLFLFFCSALYLFAALCCHLDFVFNLFMYCVLYWSLKHCMVSIIYFTSFHKHSLYFAAKIKYVKWFLLKFISSKFYSWAKVK